MKTPFDNSHQEAGFTLIEVLVAVSIMASLTAVMWISVSSMFQTRDVVTERFERYQIMRVSMDRISRELASAYLAGPEHGGEEIPGEEEDQRTGLQGGEQDGEEAGGLNQRDQDDIVQYGMIGREDEISFTAFAHVRTVEGELASRHAEISYFLERRRSDEGELVNSLMRREDVTPDDDIEDGGEVYTMIPNVEEIEFEYWDPGPVRLGTKEEVAEEGKWKDQWDTTKSEFAGRMPTRMRITVTLPPENERSEPKTFQTQVQLETTEVLEF
ncbi:MAG: type II secretion system protein GspJ [Myxococcota bacterium]